MKVSPLSRPISPSEVDSLRSIETDARPQGGGLGRSQKKEVRAAYAALGEAETLILDRAAAASVKPKERARAAYAALGKQKSPSDS
jgi:hypothetical protein